MTHDHTEECLILARARLRALRSEIALNQAFIRAYDEHNANLVEIVAYVERNLTRSNMADILRVFPGLSPPALRRQHASDLRTPLRNITEEYNNQENIANNNRPQ